MHATVRSIQCKPGRVGAVADLIRTEYVPLLEGIEGVVSYTLVDTGEDIVTSLGVFETPEAATAANDAAKSWTAERLADHVASPLSAGAGAVLVDHRGSVTH